MTKEAKADAIRCTPITRRQDLQRQSPNNNFLTEIVSLEQLGHLRFIALKVNKLCNHVITGRTAKCRSELQLPVAHIDPAVLLEADALEVAHFLEAQAFVQTNARFIR